MLKFNDILSLAKNGYTPSDIKELIELSKEADSSESNSGDKEQITEDIETPSETVAAPETPKEENTSTIEDYKKEVEDLKKQIADLQKANTRKNIADTDEKSDSEVFADVMKQFM